MHDVLGVPPPHPEASRVVVVADAPIDPTSDPVRCRRCRGVCTLDCPDCNGEGHCASELGARVCDRCRGVRVVACPTCNGAGIRPVRVKACRCGVAYDATTWAALPLVGEQDDGDGGLLELRNCRCGSTIAIALPTTEVA